MSYPFLDLVYSNLLDNVLGSVLLIVAGCIVFPLILFISMRIPPFFTFILMSPAIYGFYEAGFIPQWAGGMIFVIFGIIWTVVTRAILQER